MFDSFDQISKMASSSMSSSRPIFVLRQVNVVDLIQRYNNGEFTKVAKPPSSKIDVVKSAPIMAPTYGKTMHEATCVIKDRMDKSIIIYTSNVNNFETFTKSNGTMPKGGRCDWCRRTFTQESQGIPIAYKEEEALRLGENGVLVSQNYYAFWDEGTYCTYRCVLADIIKFKEVGPQQRDQLYLNSESALRFRFSLQYPEAGPLKPAHDYRLLKENGGSLTDEEFDSDKYVYLRTSNVLLIPAKVAYIRQ